MPGSASLRWGPKSTVYVGRVKPRRVRARPGGRAPQDAGVKVASEEVDALLDQWRLKRFTRSHFEHLIPLVAGGPVEARHGHSLPL
jgi:hypothetical protein